MVFLHNILLIIVGLSIILNTLSKAKTDKKTLTIYDHLKIAVGIFAIVMGILVIAKEAPWR